MYEPGEAVGMLEELIGELVVIDMRSPYVCLGKLAKVSPDVLVVRNADLHDLRDTETTRENYVADSVASGIKRNRKKLYVMRSEIVAISRLQDVVEA
jgi:hypothetical protein